MLKVFTSQPLSINIHRWFLWFSLSLSAEEYLAHLAFCNYSLGEGALEFDFGAVFSLEQGLKLLPMVLFCDQSVLRLLTDQVTRGQVDRWIWIIHLLACKWARDLCEGVQAVWQVQAKLTYLWITCGALPILCYCAIVHDYISYVIICRWNYFIFGLLVAKRSLQHGDTCLQGLCDNRLIGEAVEFESFIFECICQVRPSTTFGQLNIVWILFSLRLLIGN